MGILEQIDSLVWGPAMILLLLGSHLYLSVRTRFIQRKLPTAIRMSLINDTSDNAGKGDISHFGAGNYRVFVLDNSWVVLLLSLIHI